MCWHSGQELVDPGGWWPSQSMARWLLLSFTQRVVVVLSPGVQGASSEVMAIRAARCYDMENKSIVFANGQPCSLENMLATGLGKYADLVFEFCHRMTSMYTDNAEYALLTAISIFSGQ